jgi:hypothetical protein
MPIIENVVLNYTKIKEPGNKYQSEEKEWSVDVVVSREQAKAWNKDFSKQKAKEIDNPDYLKQFKQETLPFPDQDCQYVIKLKKGTKFKSGEPVPEKFHPKVYLNNGDGTIKDVTKDILVGNGSVGAAKYDVVENSFGKFAKLAAVRVDKLVEYKGAGGGGDDDLGKVVEATSTVASAPSQSVDADGPGDPFDDCVPF